MKRLGRYEILDELGRGAMGTVYRARDPKIDRIVALKTISVSNLAPADEAEYRQRFFREAQAAGRLSHGGLVTIHDVGEDEATKIPFIVMEFIQGKTLEELGRGERLPTPTTLGLVKQVAEALDYAHGQHIIHRDIKPANIIVTPDDRAKITDFGVAKLALTQFTQAGQVLGTPAYMSPEQLSGGAVDGRSDLFSLGVILYWLLTGDKPFAGDTTTAVSFKIVYQNPIPPTQINPALSADIDYALERALAKDVARRYQHGREVAEDLDDLMNGRPPRSQAAQPAPAAVEHTIVAQPRPAEATPPGATVKMPAPAIPAARGPQPAAPPPGRRRHRLMAAAVLLMLLLGGVGLWWATRPKPKQRAQPDSSTQEASVSAPASSAPSTSAPTTPPSPGTGTPKEPRASEERRRPPAQVARSRPRQAEERSRAGATATLRLTGEHNFESGTLYVYADEKLLQELRLSGHTVKRKGARIGAGKISTSFPLSAGERTISIRIKAPGDDFDQIKFIEGSFEPGQTRTLEISLGKIGRWVGIGDLTRNLTLRWVD